LKLDAQFKFRGASLRTPLADVKPLTPQQVRAARASWSREKLAKKARLHHMTAHDAGGAAPPHEPHGRDTAHWVPDLGAGDGPLPDVTGTPGGGYAGLAAGAGTGWMTEEFELLGVPFEDRGRLMAEYLAGACSPTPPTWPPRRSAWATWRAVSVF
jgi:hypothetical protein